jgi:superfamily I DNA/RNA helicase
MSGATLRAIKSWEMLRREEPITKAAAMEVYDHMSSRRGVSHGGKSSLERVPENQEITVEYLRLHHGLLVNSIWHEALDKIPPQECEYFLAALRRGEKLLKEPRIRIETIHGVKGGEADSIVVCTDMADRTWREYEQSPDDEHRVWYVAVTRARRRLFIMSPQTNMSYVI